MSKQDEASDKAATPQRMVTRSGRSFGVGQLSDSRGLLAAPGTRTSSPHSDISGLFYGRRFREAT